MNKITKYILISVIVLIAIFISIYGFTYAKYAANSIWNYYLKSNGFYFSSDLLKENNEVHVNNNWDGNSILINIKNSENKSLITEYNINYTAECTIEDDNNKKCIINNTNNSTYNSTLSKEEPVESISVKIVNIDGTPLEDQSDVVLNIEVKSTLPYSKKLKGTFKLHKNINIKDGLTAKIINYEENIIYNLSNYNVESKCIKLNWNSNDLRIDTDINKLISYKTDEYKYINEIVFTLNNSSDIDYTFYKNNLNKNYSISDIQITELNNCQ